MKNVIYIITFVISIFCYNSCVSQKKRQPEIGIKDSLRLPGIPLDKTLSFFNGLLFYSSMDGPEEQSIKCFSIEEKKLVWSRNINASSINKGIVAFQNQYVVSTLSDTVYIFGLNGDYRNILLDDRSKISPVSFQDILILHDRGTGIKGYDIKTLKEKWRIKQNQYITISQPFILDKSLIFEMDNSLNSANPLTGEINWKLPLDTLNIHDLYGWTKSTIYLLLIDLKDDVKISAIDKEKGKILWTTKLGKKINIWDKGMCATKDSIFCKGDSNITVLNAINGKVIKQDKFDSKINSNLILDKDGNILFSIESGFVIKITPKYDKLFYKFSSQSSMRFYSEGNKTYIFTYPFLYLIK